MSARHLINFAGRTLNAPVPRMTRTFQNTLIGGGMAGSLGMGAVDHFQEKRWNLERSLATGAIEIERPDFMQDREQEDE